MKTRFYGTQASIRVANAVDSATFGRNYFNVYVDGNLQGQVLITPVQHPQPVEVRPTAQWVISRVQMLA
jgi:hypothetical protein